MSLPTLPFDTLLDHIAAKTPAPGGGATACAAGALAAALAHMVVAFSLGKKNLAQHQPDLEHASATLTRARRVILELGEEDARAYALVNELYKLPEADPRRQREWLPAVRTSTQVPLAAMAAGVDLLRLFERLAPMSNKMLLSDLAIAAVLAEALTRSSRWNVAVNATSLPDAERRAVTAEADHLLAAAAGIRPRVEASCAT